MKILHTYVAVAAGLLTPAVALAQAGPSSPPATANAVAEIVEPISISCGEMMFGQLAPLSNRSASITIPPRGEPLQDPDGISVPGARDVASPSDCNVEGELNLSFTVSLPSAATLSNGGATAALSAFTISTQLGGQPLNRRLATSIGPGRGRNGFLVGATLTVAANQPPGTYRGSFPVTVQYN